MDNILEIPTIIFADMLSLHITVAGHYPYGSTHLVMHHSAESAHIEEYCYGCGGRWRKLIGTLRLNGVVWSVDV